MSIKPVRPKENAAAAQPEPFPTPNTIPAGWDMSGLMSIYNTPELLNDAMPIPVDLHVSAELTEKYSASGETWEA